MPTYGKIILNSLLRGIKKLGLDIEELDESTYICEFTSFCKNDVYLGKQQIIVKKINELPLDTRISVTTKEAVLLQPFDDGSERRTTRTRTTIVNNENEALAIIRYFINVTTD
jgi:hypothetical protein